MKYGGFWIRLCATLVDVLITGVLYGSVLFLLLRGTEFSDSPETAVKIIKNVILWFAGIMAFDWLYYALFESSKLQATPGKLLFKLKVISQSGERQPFLQASARYFSKYLSAWMLYLGYIMAAFMERKLALHDILAGTYVIKKDFPVQELAAENKGPIKSLLWIIAGIGWLGIFAVFALMVQLPILFRTSTLEYAATEEVPLIKEIREQKLAQTDYLRDWQDFDINIPGAIYNEDVPSVMANNMTAYTLEEAAVTVVRKPFLGPGYTLSLDFDTAKLDCTSEDPKFCSELNFRL